MPSDLFNKWLQTTTAKPHSGVSVYTERRGARSLGLASLKKLLADHFVGEATILQAGGYAKAAKVIGNSLPTRKQIQSGDLGELLATEYLNSETPFVVPIKKLRWKSDRETAMHGNDVICVDLKAKPIRVLKGECKSRMYFGKATAAEAAKSLDLHDGRPNPSTLAFITKRLYEQKRDEEAKVFQHLQAEGAISSKNVHHLILLWRVTIPRVIWRAHQHRSMRKSSARARPSLLTITARLSRRFTKLMAEDPEAISEALSNLIQPQARGRLLARGMARAMIWRDGVVPEGAQEFAESLTSDLLDFGYGVLALALELRDANRNREPNERFETEEPFRVAAEAIESAVRRGDPQHGDQGRHLVVSAAAFHLAGFAARSFSMLPVPALAKNLASHERALAYLLRRDLLLLRDEIIRWHADPAHSDDAIAARLLSDEDEYAPEDAALLALTTSYYQGLGMSKAVNATCPKSCRRAQQQRLAGSWSRSGLSEKCHTGPLDVRCACRGIAPFGPNAKNAPPAGREGAVAALTIRNIKARA